VRFPPLRALPRPDETRLPDLFFELDRDVFDVEPFRFAPRDDFLEAGFLDRAFVAVRVFLATALLLLLVPRPPLTALAAKAPTTPPTTAPIGPATLPTAAPATIGGI
jgi:hypothetical protein